MAPNLSYTLSDLTQAVQKLDLAGTECTQIRTSFTNLLSEIPQGWQGLAASTFQNVMSDFITQYTKVVNGLAMMKEDLSKAATQLNVTEQSNNASVSKVASLINSASIPTV